MGKSILVNHVTLPLQSRQKHKNPFSNSPTCRSQQYTELASHLSVTNAVSILPLTNKQIEAYLDRSQGHFDTVRTMLHNDPDWLDLARQPLMLYVFTRTYQKSTTMELPQSGTPEELQHAIFSDYVEFLLTRRGILPSWMSQDRVKSWLSTIATNLKRRQEIDCSIENMQPDWLPEREQRFYRECTSLSFGLLGALSLELPFGAIFNMAFGLIVGLIVGLAIGIGYGLAVGLLLGLYPVSSLDIKMAEILAWSWEDIRRELPIWLAITLTTPMVFGSAALILAKPQWLLAIVAIGLLGGALAGLPGPFLTFSTKRFIERTHLAPNEGTWRSAKNGLYFGLSASLLLGLFFGLFGTPLTGVLAGLSFGLLGAMITGLFPIIAHFILRFWLWRTEILPWNLIKFLDEADERVFLHKTGGSYRFIHLQLLEYFASLNKSSQPTEETVTDDIPASTEETTSEKDEKTGRD
jgi:hypothetical protein